jgi:hypothetical protein
MQAGPGDSWSTRASAPGRPPGFLDPQHGSWHELLASGLPVSGFPGQMVFTDPLHGMLVFTAPDRTASASATSDGGET